MQTENSRSAFRLVEGSPAWAADRFFADHFPRAGAEERRHFIYLQGMLKHLEVGSEWGLPPTRGSTPGARLLDWAYRARLKRHLRGLRPDVVLGWRKCKPGEAAFVEATVEWLLTEQQSVLLVHDGDFPTSLVARLKARWRDRLTILSALPDDLVSRKSFEFVLDSREYREFRGWLSGHAAAFEGSRFRPGMGWFFARNAALRVFAECIVPLGSCIDPLSAAPMDTFVC